MRIVVVNAYVRGNAGDAALLSVCLRHVREAFPHARTVIAGMEDAAVHPDFEGVENIGSIRRWVADGEVSLLRRVLRKLLVAPLAVLALLLPRPAGRTLLRLLPAEARREADAVSRADLVVSMGGGYLNARPGLNGHQNVFFVLLPAFLAQRAGVPVVFAPQSFGPFPARLQRRLVRRALRRSPLVLAREALSAAILEECGLPADRIGRAVDSGFAYAPEAQPDWRARLDTDPGQPLVGLTARRWLEPAAQDGYERALAEVVDRIQAAGHRVVLIPQVSTGYLGDDDILVERRIAAHCTTPPLQLDERVDYRELRSLYGECSLLVGTRFHSVIFALTSGVPCVAIGYEHKTAGIMAELGLSAKVVPIEEVTADRLWTLVGPLLGPGAEEYRALLRDRVPGYVARAEEFPAMLRALLPATAQDTARAVAQPQVSA
ncbi:colanic acid/amylovoran biosynthesis protein [Streptomyces sp. TLI_235]|nr:polysaccharide pyruvyl transferase family protein [Streptomyces sp. TLI_235]PBC77879.1 colanic acid/amylovoran biosynthesis protein [Streptomyces sp. TLI_235]